MILTFVLVCSFGVRATEPPRQSAMHVATAQTRSAGEDGTELGPRILAELQLADRPEPRLLAHPAGIGSEPAGSVLDPEG